MDQKIYVKEINSKVISQSRKKCNLSTQKLQVIDLKNFCHAPKNLSKLIPKLSHKVEKGAVFGEKDASHRPKCNANQ